MRVLGVDFGRKRIGLAVSDPTGSITSPLETLTWRSGKRPPLARIAEVGRTWKVEHLVVGLPLEPSGEENEWCVEVREMAGKLAERMEIDVSFIDERMTSAAAHRALGSVGLSRSARREKGRVDAAAAQLILQAWLDRRRHEP